MLQCSLEALTLLKWGEVETLHARFGEKCMKCAHCVEAFLKPRALAQHMQDAHGVHGLTNLPKIEDSFYPSSGIWHNCEVDGMFVDNTLNFQETSYIKKIVLLHFLLAV